MWNLFKRYILQGEFDRFANGIKFIIGYLPDELELLIQKLNTPYSSWSKNALIEELIKLYLDKIIPLVKNQLEDWLMNKDFKKVIEFIESLELNSYHIKEITNFKEDYAWLLNNKEGKLISSESYDREKSRIELALQEISFEIVRLEMLDRRSNIRNYDSAMTAIDHENSVRLILFDEISKFITAISGTLNLFTSTLKIRLHRYFYRQKYLSIKDYLIRLDHITNKYFFEIALIRSKSSTLVSITIDENYDKFRKIGFKVFLSKFRKELGFISDLNVISIERGSVIMKLEMAAKDAENLLLAIKQGKLAKFAVMDVSLLEFKSKMDQPNIAIKYNLKDVKEKLLEEVALDFERGLQKLEEVLYRDSSEYIDFVQVKSRFNQAKKMFNHGIIDYPDFRIDFNRCIVSTIDIINSVFETKNYSSNRHFYHKPFPTKYKK